jgi:hypothetical protein
VQKKKPTVETGKAELRTPADDWLSSRKSSVLTGCGGLNESTRSARVEKQETGMHEQKENTHTCEQHKIKMSKEVFY